jgi:hypothetical protein
MDWQTIEMLGYAYYSQRGYRVLVSLVRTNDYDFVVEKDGEFKRVNVKLAGLKKKSEKNSWSISQSSGSKYRAIEKAGSNVDVYLAYLPHEERFVEIDGDFFVGVNSKCKRVPRELLFPEKCGAGN